MKGKLHEVLSPVMSLSLSRISVGCQCQEEGSSLCYNYVKSSRYMARYKLKLYIQTVPFSVRPLGLEFGIEIPSTCFLI